MCKNNMIKTPPTDPLQSAHFIYYNNSFIRGIEDLAKGTMLANTYMRQSSNTWAVKEPLIHNTIA